MRIRFIKGVIIFFFVALGLSLFYIQCIQGYHYSELSQKNRIRLVPLLAPRGNIYDRTGRLLAGSRLAFDCTIIPQEFDVSEEKMRELAGLLGMEASSLKRIIAEDAVAPFIPLVLRKDIGKDTAIAISERGVDFPGLVIQTYPTRHYPNRVTGSHVVGYLGKISEGELEALREYGYEPMDLVGRGGLEFFYDDYLKGENGGMQVEVDARGRELRVLGVKEPERGKDIMVSLDLELQGFIDNLMEGSKGAVMIMSSTTGEMLSLVNKPDFDPNIFISSSRSSVISELLSRRDYPLVNRSISGTYPPGSAFKVVTASAALDLGLLDRDEQLECEGHYEVGYRRFNCWKRSGHKMQNIVEGIKNSCNVFFYKTGRRVGVDSLSDYAAQYGFGARSGIDLPYEAEGVVPTRSWKQRNIKESWYEGDTLNLAIGQGYLLVTPIQVLCMINALATEGQLIRPFLAKEIEGVEVYSDDRKWLNISGDVFRTVKEGTRSAVNGEHGTAGAARVDGLDIAGKTGTAQAGPEGTHAWFAGYSPSDRPRISLVIFLEYGGKGGDRPCKMAARIFEKLAELDYL